MTTYSLEQLNDLYKKLPAEIKEMIISDDTQENIYKVLEEHGLLDERAGLISSLIRDVLFGLLPPENFEPSLKKEIGLNQNLAKEITQEINRFVFFPIKTTLNDLYKIEAEGNVVNQPNTESESVTTKPGEKKITKSDSYLESIE